MNPAPVLLLDAHVHQFDNGQTQPAHAGGQGQQRISAAARGGVKVNDLVLAVAGQPVGDAPTFAAVIATGSGDTTLKILRGTQMLQLTVNLQPK